MRWLNPFVWWRKRQRAIDRTILIPELLSQSVGPLQFAKAFALHASMDRAWRVEDWEFNLWERVLVARVRADLTEEKA